MADSSTDRIAFGGFRPPYVKTFDFQRSQAEFGGLGVQPKTGQKICQVDVNPSLKRHRIYGYHWATPLITTQPIVLRQTVNLYFQSRLVGKLPFDLCLDWPGDAGRENFPVPAPTALCYSTAPCDGSIMLTFAQPVNAITGANLTVPAEPQWPFLIPFEFLGDLDHVESVVSFSPPSDSNPPDPNLNFYREFLAVMSFDN